MGEVLLTVDLGNSSCKVCAWSCAAGLDAQPLRTARFDLGPELGTQVHAWASRGTQVPVTMAISSVAAPEYGVGLRAALGSELTVLDPPPHGLKLAVRSPETVGLDRLFAARGALAHSPRGALVLDAGTALTVDAVAEGAGFLGGAIAPGPQLLAEALSRGGARLPEFEARPHAPALGRETRCALEAGVAVGFAGAALHLARGVARESGLEAVPLVLTGGAAIYLREALAELEVPLIEDEHLVHRGLLLAAGGGAL